MIVYTRPCVMCRMPAILTDVDPHGYAAWKELGWNIQDALPELSADERELLMTGTHAHCWEKMWT
jgi:hypothetical protein